MAFYTEVAGWVFAYIFKYRYRAIHPLTRSNLGCFGALISSRCNR
jgi:SNF family Na+-dependent transporter